MAQAVNTYSGEQHSDLTVLPGGRLSSSSARRRATGGVSLFGVMRPVCVSVRASTDLETLGSLLLAFRLSAVPVVDDDGALIGCVSQTDALREVVESAEWNPTGLTVGEIMRRDVTTIAETASIAQAAAVMALDGVNILPVVSKAGALVGIIDGADIVGWVAERSGHLERRPTSFLPEWSEP